MPWQPTLRDWARRIKFDGVALWVACSHAQAPWWAKLLAVVTYALTPVDLIPDVISVPGYLDGVLLLPGLIWLTVRLIPPVVRHSCRAQADAWLAREGRKPRSRLGLVLVLVLFVWAVLGWVLWAHLLAPHLPIH